MAEKDAKQLNNSDGVHTSGSFAGDAAAAAAADNVGGTKEGQPGGSKKKVRRRRAEQPDDDALGLRSIQFRTWLSFVTLTAITLIILWFVQILFYTSGFKQMNKSELKRVGDTLSGYVFDKDFGDRLRDRALEGGFSALVFTGEKDELIFNFANANGSTLPESLDSELFGQVLDGERPFRDAVNNTPGSVVYTLSVPERGNFIVYGDFAINRFGTKFYLCLVKPLQNLDTSVSVLRNQLVIVTIICMLLSMLLSLSFSRSLSRPITRFSQVARKLGKGDFSVRFEGNGWTEIDELADTLNYATEEMGKTESLRRDFLANVSHDLRTPLTMVRAYAEMIRDVSGANKEKREAHAQIIIDEAERLATLVGDILDLSKLQAGTDQPVPADVNISALTETVLTRFAAMSEKSGYKFKSSIEPDLSAYCDGRRIEQVLYNLIGNAMNYTGNDRSVGVVVSDAGERVRVEISDSGKGIAQNEKDAVWDRYYRASQTKRTTVGTGLGLSIVKNILLAHGAAYGIDSVTEDSGFKSGTTFWFELNKSKPPAVLESFLQEPASHKTRGHRLS